MSSGKSALDVLKETSRTFYIPISYLPDGLKEAVASAYLCMRAIDEIEDNPTLDPLCKVRLLKEVSLTLQSGIDGFVADDFSWNIEGYERVLPEVTVRIGEWASLAPLTIAPRIWDATAAMADRMAHWAEYHWLIETKSDLDRYTFSVAGAVGLLLSDLWAWYDGTQTDRLQAIGFGRGLQAVNILRNRIDDLTRNVDFFPKGWGVAEMQQYARYNLNLADAYTRALPPGPASDFCQIPLALAHETLAALAEGEVKLSRSRVLALVEQVLRANANTV
jgi:farnesyl-diphosphate farnesyltransferase